MTSTPRLTLPFLASNQAQKHVTLNEGLRRLDLIVQAAAASRTLTLPPGSPEESACWIVGEGAIDAWSGHEGELAGWQDGAWAFAAPQDGWRVYVLDEAALLVWREGSWQPAVPDPEVLQNLGLLGIGTEADAENPFAAKLNTALWTARYDAEGGDGDLRYTLNKEASGNTLSLLMQSGWSGHAEIGLVGNDNLSFRVSADGDIWKTALSFDGATGAAAFSAPVSIEPGSGSGLAVRGSGATGLSIQRSSANSGSSNIYFRKTRGSVDAPEVVQSADNTGYFIFAAWDGSAWQESAYFGGVVDGSVSAGNVPGRIVFATGTSTASRAERLRINSAGDLQMGGANTVINASRHPVLRAYTVAALPSASPVAQMIYVSDGAGNRHLAVSDGSVWRWPDGSVAS